MTSVRDEGLRVFRELLPGLLPDADEDVARGEFGGELAELGLENVFGRLWTRESLDRRSRSLVALGILIALRAIQELKLHFSVALRKRAHRRRDCGSDLSRQRLRKISRSEPGAGDREGRFRQVVHPSSGTIASGCPT